MSISHPIPPPPAYYHVFEGVDKVLHILCLIRLTWRNGRECYFTGCEDSPEKHPGHPAKGMTLGVYVYIWWGTGHEMLFSRSLQDLVGRKTSGQKGTDSIRCGQAQGSAFCDKHIKSPSPVLHSAWPATVLAQNLNSSSFRQFPEAAGQETKRTVNKTLK